MKLSFAALAALLTAGGVPQSALYAQAPQRNPTFRSRSHKSLELRRNLGGTRATIGSAGSTASASETGNISFAIVWRLRRATVKSGNDWSIGYAK